MAIVVFDPDEFRRFKPRYAQMTNDELGFMFSVAEGIVENTARADIPYDPDAVPPVLIRKTILYLLVCHLAGLEERGPGAVGAVTGVTQGSVSTQFQALTNTNNDAWWNQTQCGAIAWKMLLPFVLGGRSYNGCFR